MLFETINQIDEETINLVCLKQELAHCKFKKDLAAVARVEKELELMEQKVPNETEFVNHSDIAKEIYNTMKEAMNENKMYNEVLAIASSIKKLPDNKYTLFWKKLSYMKLAKYCKDKSLWNNALEWLAIIDPSCLDKKPYEKMPAQLETYYLISCKALSKTKNWSKCLELAEIGKRECFESENSVWFDAYKYKSKARISMSKNDVNSIKQAIKDLENFSNIKKGFFIYSEISDLYFSLENYDNALTYISKAINCPPFKNEFKWELFFKAYRILSKMGKEEKALKHFKLSYIIRKSRDWKIPEELQNIATDLKLSDKDFNQSEEDIVRELKGLWKDWELESLPKDSGIIKNIFPNKKGGFITSENNGDIFFKASNFNGQRFKIKEGILVEFYIEDSFDHKKNQKSKEATNCKVVNEE